ncbi:CIC11C00000000439 [Sungouiella intermedia]|uniref:CIC11C00000000439 n=1 Tax=Sungouiella intermedia TaxID=45354 RepID=A0A1L0BX69_9ASCO|nr:CIC11C00000000439 [[Candida] intermedia]
MLLEGYGSSSEDDSDVKVERNITDVERAAPTDKDDAVAPKSIGVGGTGTKRLKTQPKGRKLRKPGQDPADMDYVGPWGKSSDSSDNEEEPEEAATPNVTQEVSIALEPSEVVTTELYALDAFMESGKDEKCGKNEKNTEFSIPKRIVCVLKGHTKSVTKVRFFPGGRMILSSGNDGKIYLWNLKTRDMVRGYFGHSQAVKDIVFNASGSKFVSAGLDKKVLLWDTKTGAILHSLNLDAIPNAIIFNPNNENEIVVGLLSRRIEHFDLSQSNSPIQIYDHHLGAINSLTVVDSNKKFMSTSDDRTIRFWDWQINIPCKIIADPTQHSTPYAAVHPTESFIALQMMDNTIQVIQGSGKFRYNRNKTFKGHRVAGYGIQVAISPDGLVLMSGDIGGYIYFWKWRTGGFIKKMKVCDSLISCIDVCSKGLAAAGGSGDIYYCE